MVCVVSVVRFHALSFVRWHDFKKQQYMRYMSSICRSIWVFSNILLEKAVDFRYIHSSYPANVLPLSTLVHPNLVINTARGYGRWKANWKQVEGTDKIYYKKGYYL